MGVIVSSSPGGTRSMPTIRSIVDPETTRIRA